jgi:hypothetical protein
MKRGSSVKESAGQVFISIRFEGAEAERFLNYKESQFLKNNAEAARKLMFERLAQIDRKNGEAA